MELLNLSFSFVTFLFVAFSHNRGSMDLRVTECWSVWNFLVGLVVFGVGVLLSLTVDWIMFGRPVSRPRFVFLRQWIQAEQIVRSGLYLGSHFVTPVSVKSCGSVVRGISLANFHVIFI